MTLPEGMPEALGPLDKPEEVVWAGPADQPIVGGVFDEVTSTRAKEIIARYPQSRSALLPLLHLVQSVEGHVSQDGIRFCADALELTTAEVSAVVTFYTMYKRTPCGEHLVSVCTNTLCAALGGDAIYRRLQEKLGTDGEPLGHEETSADGAITLEHAECLAACDLAPVIQVNYEFYDNQDVDKAEELVDALRRGEKPHPTRGAPSPTSAPSSWSWRASSPISPPASKDCRRHLRRCWACGWPPSAAGPHPPCPTRPPPCRRRNDRPHHPGAHPPLGRAPLVVDRHLRAHRRLPGLPRRAAGRSR